MKREPLVTAATIVAVVGAVVALLVAFGVDLTEGQVEAILGFALVVAPLAVAVAARGQVTPVADPRDDAGTPLTPAARHARTLPALGKDGRTPPPAA